MFTKEYVVAILTPFIGKELRMYRESEDKSFSVPFCLETSIESSFQMEFTNLGIKFLLKGNYYVKKDIETSLNDAFRKIGIYPFSLDKLLKEEPDKDEDCVVLKQLRSHLQEALAPQIAFTYYNMVQSLKVTNRSFTLNGIKFIVCN